MAQFDGASNIEKGAGLPWIGLSCKQKIGVKKFRLQFFFWSWRGTPTILGAHFLGGP